ncbi:MAG: putative toxin-antitoxin system toxin component, PIN family [Nitrospira sp.]|nr:MAG: putative toxin-antitoxin system toxin component, PIN family [Nitrospira sp.]
MVGRAATIVRPSRNIAVLNDAPDNRILECAVTAQADLIVTGDHHLLKQKSSKAFPLSD